MKSNQKNIIMIIITILLSLMLFSLFYSCKCNIRENFEDIIMKPSSKNSVKLNKDEIKKIVEIATNSDELEMNNIINKIKKQINDTNPDEDNNTEETSETNDTETKDEQKKDISIEKENITLSKKEAELFNAIKKDKINNEELDYLIKSGVVNENMISRFLQKMEEVNNNQSDIEEFTSCGQIEGFSSCARDYATF